MSALQGAREGRGGAGGSYRRTAVAAFDAKRRCNECVRPVRSVHFQIDSIRRGAAEANEEAPAGGCDCFHRMNAAVLFA